MKLHHVQWHPRKDVAEIVVVRIDEQPDADNGRRYRRG
jgi:hypothetical protein